MGRLTLDQIAKIDLGTKEVHVEEWGGEVLIRALGYDEFQEARVRATDAADKFDELAYARELLIAGVVDPEINADNVDAFLGRSAPAIGTLTTEIIILTSGVGGVTEAEATFP